MGSCLIRMFTLVCFLCCLSSGQQYSSIWGTNGEKWDTTRIADYTNAGYKKGRVPIPQFPISVNVKTLGAKGDGKSDDRQYIQAAIRQCAPNGSVYFPKGTYVINDSLIIGKSNISLKGESRDSTILFIKKGLEELYPKYNGSQSSWSWEGAMIMFNGNISNVGIENLTVLFPDSLYEGHNFHERGYNGIGFAAGVTDGWLRNITIINADLGIYLRDAQQVSCLNWKLAFIGVRDTEHIPAGVDGAGESVSGHHGVNCYASHNLFHNFVFTRNYFHHLSVEPPAAPGLASYNVFSCGTLPDARFDHHTNGCENRCDHNLWTDIDAGIGSDIYNSSGPCAPLRHFLYETFWNIKGQKSTGSDPDPTSKNNNFIAVDRENMRTVPPAGIDPYVERIPTNAVWLGAVLTKTISPANLYWAQMKLLHNVDPSIVDSVAGGTAVLRNAKFSVPDGRAGFAVEQNGLGITLLSPDKRQHAVRVFDLSGHCIYAGNIEQGAARVKIDLRAKGVYFVKIAASGNGADFIACVKGL